ncbi:hypothetical protein WA158_001267 [Blastocystis sp. Blastoise]
MNGSMINSRSRSVYQSSYQGQSMNSRDHSYSYSQNKTPGNYSLYNTVNAYPSPSQHSSSYEKELSGSLYGSISGSFNEGSFHQIKPSETQMSMADYSTQATRNIDADDIVKERSLQETADFQSYSKKELVYWQKKTDSKGMTFYIHKITGEVSYVRPPDVDPTPERRNYLHCPDDALSVTQEESGRILSLKERFADLTPTHNLDGEHVISTQQAGGTLFQTEDILKQKDIKYIVKWKKNFFITKVCRLLVSPLNACMELKNNKNENIGKFEITQIKKVDLYRNRNDTVIITFSLAEGLSISKAVESKVHPPLIITFESSKDRTIFMHTINHIKRAKHDELIKSIKDNIEKEEREKGIIKWNIAELTYKGSRPLIISFHLPHSAVDSGRLRIETRQHVIYKEVLLVDIKNIIKGNALENGLASIYLILSDNSKYLFLFNDVKARDSFLTIMDAYRRQ